MGRLQTARLENFIRRWGSIKGSGSVLSETLGDVFPVLDLENLAPENYLPAGWAVVTGFVNVVGVAAQLSGAQLFNPADSGVIAVVDQVIVNSELAQIMTFGTGGILGAGIVNSRNIDGRQASIANGQLVVRASTAFTAQLGGRFRTVAGEDYLLTAPNGLAVLSPNTGFSLATNVVNSDLGVTFFGRARIAEPSELSF